MRAVRAWSVREEGTGGVGVVERLEANIHKY